MLKTSLTAGLIAAMSTSAVMAGGPVVVEEVEEVAQKPGSSVGILPIIIVGVALCAALCGGDDEPVPQTSAP